MKLFDICKSRSNFAGLHYTTKHSGKMLNVFSLSTDINSNPICRGRQKIEGSICSKCFAARMFNDLIGRYRSVNRAFKRNTEILTKRLLKDNEIPRINPERVPIFRFEAYGDLMNVIQVLNYFKICYKNPAVAFALWTKNPGFLIKALKVAPKPANLQIVLSSMNLNSPAHAERFSFVDKVFTVYDDDTIKRDRVNINCGARSCMGCQLCYRKNPAGVKQIEVRERLK